MSKLQYHSTPSSAELIFSSSWPRSKLKLSYSPPLNTCASPLKFAISNVPPLFWGLNPPWLFPVRDDNIGLLDPEGLFMNSRVASEFLRFWEERLELLWVPRSLDARLSLSTPPPPKLGTLCSFSSSEYSYESNFLFSLCSELCKDGNCFYELFDLWLVFIELCSLIPTNLAWDKSSLMIESPSSGVFTNSAEGRAASECTITSSSFSLSLLTPHDDSE